jgi:hypothetical protein
MLQVEAAYEMDAQKNTRRYTVLRAKGDQSNMLFVRFMFMYMDDTSA